MAFKSLVVELRPRPGHFETLRDRSLSFWSGLRDEGLLLRPGVDVYAKGKRLYLMGTPASPQALDEVARRIKGMARTKRAGLGSFSIRPFWGAYLHDSSLCACVGRGPLILYASWPEQGSPLLCVRCWNPIASESPRLEKDLLGNLLDWQSQYCQVYSIWISSGLYEVWARDVLRDAGSAINKLGLLLRRRLQIACRTPVHYWLLARSSARCPRCERAATRRRDGFRRPVRLCERCGIVLF